MTTSHRVQTSGTTGSLPVSAMQLRADKPPVAPLSPLALSQPVASVPTRLALRGRSRDRRGVLLLVVLSILVLFVVIAVTFVLIAGHARRGARPEIIAERYTNDPQRQMEDAVLQVFRGTDNVQSVIGPHGLLEDMYGGPSLSGFISQAPMSIAGGQLIDIVVTTSAQYAAPLNTLSSQMYGYYNGQVFTMLSGPARGLSTRIVGYCPTTGGADVFRVMAFDGITTANFVAAYNANVEQRFLVNGRAFNGTGFGYNISQVPTFPRPAPSGGIISSSFTLLDAQDQNNWFYALLPNPKYFQSPATPANYPRPEGPGGADEDYDAPDPQNMALAYVPFNGGNPNAAITPSSIIPSFHRPDLARWYQNKYTSDWNASPPTLQRKVILRPLQQDHPAFTGSNPSFTAASGPWDVDNDGDGTPESVWLDLGYPVLTAADGKTYKPLFAFLVLDMDGRLNVNAHGNLAQLTYVDSNGDPLNTSTVQGPFALASGSNTTAYPPGGGSTQLGPTSTITSTTDLTQNAVQLQRGQGYGPADINLGYGLAVNPPTPQNILPNPIFPSYSSGSNTQQTYQEYYQLLTGSYGATSATTFDGRYGEINSGVTVPMAGLTHNTNNATAITVANTFVPNSVFNSASDALSLIKHFDVPRDYFTPFTATYNLTSYGLPPDLWGQGTVGLDYRGQPVYGFPALSGKIYTGNTSSPTANINFYDVPNSPYSIDLSRTGVRAIATQQAIDNPFTPAELERYLRYFDVDASALQDRLRVILEGVNDTNASIRNGGVGTPNPALRQMLTTDSYDVPGPGFAATTEMRSALVTQVSNQNPSGGNLNNAAAVNINIADLLRAKLVAGGFPATTPTAPATTTTVINGQLVKMLPPELVAGQCMDLNRPFGNGRDDNNNSVVDEPSEYASASEAAWGTTTNNITTTVDGTSAFPSTNLTSFSPATAVPFNLINNIDFNNDKYTSVGSVSAAQLYARQLYARHLYVLMMMLMDQTFITGPSGGSGPTGVALWASGQLSWGVNAESNLTATEQQELTSRRIAQWAVNVVDYRDADAAMTPFEYDANPFNGDGWSVDGIIGTSDDSTAPDRRVVWGCEYPELMISETFAMHDRRVRDTNNDTSGFATNKQSRFIQNPGTPPPVYVESDGTLDQIRVSQGSLFVELYCPRGNTSGTLATAAASQTVYPPDLYTYNAATNQWYLDLGRMTPDGKYPVWRLAVLSSNLQNPTTNGNDIMQRMQGGTTYYPATTSLDPPGDKYSGSIFNNNNVYNPGGFTNATIERIAWFTTTAPANNTGVGARIFYNQGVAPGTSVLLPPGGYAVVGPRAVTTFGRVLNNNTAATDYSGTVPAPNSPAAISPQAIVLTPNNNSATTSTAYTNITQAVTGTAPSVEYVAAFGGAGSVAQHAVVGTNIQQPVAIICAGEAPQSWSNSTNTAPTPNSQSGNSNTGKNSPNSGAIGLSISEPLFSSTYYYTEPTQADNASQAVAWYGSNFKDAYGGNATPYLDQPFETFYYNSAASAPSLNAQQVQQTPLLYDSLVKTSTYVNYKTVVLQRLANPTLTYNPVPGDVSNSGDPNEPTFNSANPVNPYVTVDWMPVNLTVFNGEQVPLTAPSGATGSTTVAGIHGNPLYMDPDETAYTPTTTQLPVSATAAAYFGGGTTGYGTSQRGTTSAAAAAGLNIWGQYQDAFPAASGVQTPSPSNVFDYNLTGSTSGSTNNGQTLGYLNKAFVGNNGAGYPWSTSDTPPAPAKFAGDPNPANWTSAVNNINTQYTFPSISWANRPFVSQYEIMQVPASAPGRLMWEFGYTGSRTSQQTPTVPPYSQASVTAGQTTAFLAPFKHLLNFLMSETQGTTGTAPQFYRLFDYVNVPSRFVGTETILNPNAMYNGNSALSDTNTSFPAMPYQNSDNNQEKVLFSYLHPPFNKVSKYRDPGKVNINTIPHLYSYNSTTPIVDRNPIIWNAIVNDPAPAQQASTGTPPAYYAGDPTTAGPNWQSLATSINGAAVVGALPTLYPYPFRSSVGADLCLPGLPAAVSGINMTLLRADLTYTNQMLFDFPPPAITHAASSITPTPPPIPALNAPDSNSYFRYQNLQRMGNLLTTRSNVYAVWVTVGYFQVQPVTASAVYPDGYTLADEIGSDTGDIVRHRAFYMFDRTIPVAFERGMNHNVDRAIILRRYIE